MRSADEPERRVGPARLRDDTFYSLVRNNPFGVYVVDAAFRLREVSEGAQKVFGGVRPLLGRDFAEVLRILWTEPFATEAIDRFRHTLATGERYVQPRTVERRRNVEAVEAYDWRIERITLPDGEHGVVCYFYDLSERQRYESQLAESEARLRLALKASATGIWSWDFQSGRVDWSDECYAIHGVAPGAFDGTTDGFRRLVHPDDVDRVWRAVTSAVADHDVYSAEFRVVRPSGEVRWVTNSAQAFYDESGTPLRMLGTIVDVTDRKAAELGLRESEARLGFALSAADAGVWDWNIAAGEVRWSPHNFELYGVKPERGELSYERWLECIHPEDRDKAQAAVQAAVNGSAPAYRTEFRVLHPGGACRWVLASGRLERAADGTPVRMSGVNIDITGRKAIESALAASVERLHLAQEAGGLGIHDYDVAAGELRWDHRVRRWWGVDETERVTYELFMAALHPEDRDATQAAVARAFDPAGGGRYDAEYRVVNRKDGTVRWIAATGQTTFQGEKPVRLVGTVQDVTHQKAVEATLRESEARFRSMANTAPAMLWVAEADGSCSFISSGWEAFTGQPEFEALGFGWLEMVHPDDRAGAKSAFLNAVRERRAFSHDQRVRSADGTWRWVIDAGRPRMSEDGAFLGFIGSVIDVDDRRRAEAALVDADRRKTEFLAVLAHELRNPLAPIRNALHLLRLVKEDPVRVDAARVLMDRQVEHMVRLVDDLLDISRISHGKLALNRERMNLVDALRSAIETTQPGFDTANHELHVDLPESPIPVDGDLVRLAQVFANLLNNAARYTPPGGRVALSVRQHDDRAIVTVEDNGIGIPAEMLELVFEPFQQGSHARGHTRKELGLGLGLALARRLVELHGGRISAASAGPGLGSCFTVVLPCASHLPSKAEPSIVTLARQRPLRILVVDDNEDAADSLCAVLRIVGHEVEVAGTGLAALDAVGRSPRDVAIIDIGMPGMNGYELARRLRVRPDCVGLRIVAVTGHGQAEDVRRSAEAGIDVHLVKPIDPGVLQDVIARLASGAVTETMGAVAAHAPDA